MATREQQTMWNPHNPTRIERSRLFESGVCEKNDADKISTWAPRGLPASHDFNVEWASAVSTYKMRHFFRKRIHSQNSSLQTTLISGRGGANINAIRPGVIFSQTPVPTNTLLGVAKERRDLAETGTWDTTQTPEWGFARAQRKPQTHAFVSATRS